MKLFATYGNNPDAWNEMVYEIPVMREVVMVLDWFGGLIWYWKIGVVIGAVMGIWVFLKVLKLIFGTSDE